MITGFGISIDGFPYVLTAGEVTIPSTADSTKWEPADDMPNGCGQADALQTPRVSWSEVMAPVDGTLDVNMLTFRLFDVLVSYGGSDVRLCSYLLARDPSEIASTVLTTSAQDGSLELNIPTIASTSFTSGYPKVLYVGGEAIYCDSYSGGVVTVNNAGRGYYGSRARTYKRNDDVGAYPEVWAEPPPITGRRMILWAFADDGKAYAVWRGTVSRGPELQQDGSWTISCDHVWTSEKNRSLGDPAASARPVGFEPSAVAIGIDCTNSFFGGTFDSGVLTWYGWNAGGTSPLGGDVVNGGASMQADEFCDRLQRILAARLQSTTLVTGARATANTDVAVRVERAGNTVTYSLRCGNTGSGDPQIFARVLTKQFRARMKDEGGGIYSGTLTFDLPQCALTFEAAKSGGIILDDPFTISPRAGTGNDYASERNFSRVWTDGSFRTTVRDVLAGDYDNETRFVFYPEDYGATGRVAYVSRDGRKAVNANTETFAQLDFGGAISRYFGGAGAQTLFLDRSVRLVYTQWVTCDHWVYGLQHALEDATISTESDPRNWDWSTADTVARATASELSSREWYLDGSLKMGELISDTLILDGCGLAVRSGGRLSIVAVRPPMAHWREGYESSAITATITTSDLIHGCVPQWKPLTDSLVSGAKIMSSVEGVIVRDQRTRQRYGQRREVELALTGLPRARQNGSDARALAQRAMHRIIGLWGELRFMVTFKLPIDRLFGSTAIYAGDYILATEWNLPDGTGTRGLSNVPLFIMGRDVQLGEEPCIEYIALLMPVAYGYAPCIKVNDMTIGYPSAGKTTIVADTQYIYAGSADENDYAGAISDDLGVGWFQAGDKVALYLRDDTSGQREVSLTVESVDTVSGSLVVTPEVPLVPYDWDAAVIGGLWVDLVYDQAVVLTDDGQKSFAFVGTGNAGDGTIAFSGDTQRSRRFAP